MSAAGPRAHYAAKWAVPLTLSSFVPLLVKSHFSPVGLHYPLCGEDK